MNAVVFSNATLDELMETLKLLEQEQRAIEAQKRDIELLIASKQNGTTTGPSRPAE